MRRRAPTRGAWVPAAPLTRPDRPTDLAGSVTPSPVNADNALRDLVTRSIEVIAREQTAGGAYPACSTFSVYGYAWLRDGSFVADGMSAHGVLEGPSAFHDWTARVIRDRAERIDEVVASVTSGRHIAVERFLPTRYTLDGDDGSEGWWDFQLDGYGIWLWALDRHLRRHSMDGRVYRELLISRCGTCLPRGGYPATTGGRSTRSRYTCRRSPRSRRASKRRCAPDCSAMTWPPGNATQRPGRTGASRQTARVDGRLRKWLGSAAVDASLLAAVAPFNVVDLRVGARTVAGSRGRAARPTAACTGSATTSSTAAGGGRCSRGCSATPTSGSDRLDRRDRTRSSGSPRTADARRPPSRTGQRPIARTRPASAMDRPMGHRRVATTVVARRIPVASPRHLGLVGMIRHRPFGSGHPYEPSIDQREPDPSARRRAGRARRRGRPIGDRCPLRLGRRKRSPHVRPAASAGATSEGGRQRRRASRVRRSRASQRERPVVGRSPPVAAVPGAVPVHRDSGQATRRTRWFDVLPGALDVHGRHADRRGCEPPRARSVGWLADATGSHRVRFALRLDAIRARRRLRRTLRPHRPARSRARRDRVRAVQGSGRGWPNLSADAVRPRSRRRRLGASTSTPPGAPGSTSACATPDCCGSRPSSAAHPTSTRGPLLRRHRRRGAARVARPVGAPTELPPWVFRLWASSNEWNTQERVLAEIARHRRRTYPSAWWLSRHGATSRRSRRSATRATRVHADGSPHRLADFSFPPTARGPTRRRWSDTPARAGRTRHAVADPAGEDAAASSPARRKRTQIRSTNVGTAYGEADGRPYRNRGWWFPLALMPDFTNPRGARVVAGQAPLPRRRGRHRRLQDRRRRARVGPRPAIRRRRRVAAPATTCFPGALRGGLRRAVVGLRQGAGHLQPSRLHRIAGTRRVLGRRRGLDLGGDAHITARRPHAPRRAASSTGAGTSPASPGRYPTPSCTCGRPRCPPSCRSCSTTPSSTTTARPSRDRTPWNIAELTGDPDVLTVFRRYAHLRERLVPYLVRQARRTLETGWPLLRSISLSHPGDAQAWAHPYEFFLGNELLVAPVVEPAAQSSSVYLPAGTWIDVWTSSPVNGGRTITVDTPIDQVPVWCRQESWSQHRSIFTG